MKFRDSVCVITGGASGIGRAVCERIAAEDKDVVIVDIDEGKGEGDAERQCRQAHAHALFINTYVSSSSQSRLAMVQIFAA